MKNKKRFLLFALVAQCQSLYCVLVLFMVTLVSAFPAPRLTVTASPSQVCVELVGVR